MRHLEITPETYVLVLTGAGASAESGIPTFRGGGGFWNGLPVNEVATPMGFAADPGQVWRLYSERRRGVEGSQPNEGHLALARLEKVLGDRFLLVTQNVDGLHQAAGSERVVEMHGNLMMTRCSSCDLAPFEDRASHGEEPLPTCEACGALLRPHITWFGEEVDPAHIQRFSDFLDEAQGNPFHYIAVGTSGRVFPAASLVHVSRRHGATTWLINAEPAHNVRLFDHFLQGASGEVLPGLLDQASEEGVHDQHEG